MLCVKGLGTAEGLGSGGQFDDVRARRELTSKVWREKMWRLRVESCVHLGGKKKKFLREFSTPCPHMTQFQIIFLAERLVPYPKTFFLQISN